MFKIIYFPEALKDINNLPLEIIKRSKKLSNKIQNKPL